MKDWPARSVRKALRSFGLQIHRTHTLSAHEFDNTFLRLTAMRSLGFNPATICDIGASDGSWSRRCQEVFPQARYFCVDPLVENQPSLARFSGECANVSYWRGCLGSKKGSVTLNVDGHGTSVLSGHTGNPYGIQREVEIETLDNLIQRGVCPEPDLLKLDVQGYELEVLKGAMGALRKTQAVIAELSLFPFQSGMPVFHEVVGQLAAHSFVVYDILSLSVRPLDGALAQTDLLFVQATHPLRCSNKWDRHSVY